MSKQKTHKGASKRVKVTGKGKLVRRRAFGSHLLTKKSADRKRKIRKDVVVGTRDESKLRELLGR